MATWSQIQTHMRQAYVLQADDVLIVLGRPKDIEQFRSDRGA